MFKRLIKILSCVLVIAIIISISLAPIHAHAIAAPIVVGGVALAVGGLAWAISSAMGVDLAINNQTVSTIGDWFNPYYSIQSTLNTSDFEFIKGLRTGYDALKLSVTAYNAIKEASKNIINDYNFDSYDSGSIDADYSVSGVPLYNLSGGYYYSDQYIKSSPGYYQFGDIGLLIEKPNNYFKYTTIWADGSTSVNSTTGTNSFGRQFRSNGSSVSTRVWMDSYWSSWSTVSSPKVSLNLLDNNFDYTSGDINTNFGQNALDNITVVFPETVLSSTATLPEVIEAINTLALANDQDVSVEIDLQPQPQPTPVPIPTTPLGDVPYDEWYDTFGQSVFDAYNHINLGQDALITVNTGIAENVDDLVGLETDIDETLQDGIVYGSRTADATEDISTELTSVGSDVSDIADDVVVIVDEMGNVVDVLEGIEAQEYINGQTLGNIKTDTQAISTELADVADDVDDLTDILPDVATLPDIKIATETLTDALPDIAVLPDIKTATETLTDTLPDIATLPDIKTATETIEDTLTDTLPDIITKIDDATTTITDEIPKLDDICENIDEAPLKDLDTGVTRLPSFILPYLVDLRDALGIWHYVTEWVSYINTTFSFILGVLAGTSILTPIYASIAGYICIRAYRRMCN